MRPIIKPFNRAVIVSLAFLLMGLSACGFQLRGSNLQALQDANVYIQSSGAKILTAEVKQQLLDADVTPVASLSSADYIVTLRNESFDRKVLSVSPSTGKVEEYELTYSAMFSIASRDGSTTVKNEALSVSRDYTFDEGSVLSKIDEETVLRKDIAKQATAAVLRRLRAAVQ